MKKIPLFLIAFVSLIVVDMVWIGGVAIGFYRSELGSLVADTVNWPAALLFYVFYSIALLIFVVGPALAAGSVKKALTLGACFGFAAYMTYDLTNLATTRGWPLSITIVDLVWGTVLTAGISTLVYVLGKKFKLG